jgi:CBS domain-containing membrane protein
MKSWLIDVLPQLRTGDRFEKARAALGVLFGLIITAIASYALVGHSMSTWMIAPMGASAVLAFGMPASPLAQPWSIVGGNVVSALIGVTCAKLVADPMLAAPLACCLAIAAMFPLRCLHPPSGAVALTAVLGGPAIHAAGYSFALIPVGVNSMILVATALFYNNSTGRRFPHRQRAVQLHPHKTADSVPTQRLGFTSEDLDVVLKQYNQVLDISRDDLEEIFHETEQRAYQRRFGTIRCADIMSRDGVTVEVDTPLDEAWQLFSQHGIHALPVLDVECRVIGIVTHTDFLKHVDHGSVNYGHLRTGLRRLLQQFPGNHSITLKTIGQIMAKPVKTVFANLAIVDLVPLMADAGLHHMPVVDQEDRFVGIVTQSDLVAALYASRLTGSSS